MPGGTDEFLRRSQLTNGVNRETSFAIRSFQQNLTGIDSLFSFSPTTIKSKYAAVDGTFQPFTIEQQYNTHHPYGWNDGSFIPNTGLAVRVSGGIKATIGKFSIQLQPEVVVAQNNSFETFFSAYYDTTWSRYYQWLNKSDIPERFGTGSYKKIFGGQSSIRYNGKYSSLGISTENMWWGPGIRNALVMSNNAPGFLHLTYNSTRPVETGWGTIEWQVVAGALNNSGILPPGITRRYITGSNGLLYVPKNEDTRYLTGMVFSWQPKWVKGLFMGFAKTSYQYKSDISGLADILPLEGLIKSSSEKNGKKASLGSLFIRYVMPEEKAELYMEYGRSDKSANPVNLVFDNAYPRAYVAGMRKLLPSRNHSFIEVMGEITQMQLPASYGTPGIQTASSWYTHDYVRQGYTQMGKVLGAGIGPGSNSQMLGIAWVKGINKVGIQFERLLHNNDFYYNAFQESSDFRRHWVDLSTTVSVDYKFNRFLFSAQMALIRSLNYEWWYLDVVPLITPNDYFRNGYDVLNFNAKFGISYRL
jgi:hypothetical protein